LSRTVYVSNVDEKITPLELIGFFNACCGPILKSKAIEDQVWCCSFPIPEKNSNSKLTCHFFFLLSSSFADGQDFHLRVRLLAIRFQSRETVRHLPRQLPHQVSSKALFLIVSRQNVFVLSLFAVVRLTSCVVRSLAHHLYFYRVMVADGKYELLSRPDELQKDDNSGSEAGSPEEPGSMSNCADESQESQSASPEKASKKAKTSQ